MFVVITGASSGFGEATAKAFAAQKKNLILIARRIDRLQKLAQQLSTEHSVVVHCFKLDIRSSAEVKALIQQNQTHFGQTQILVNNAGLARGREPLAYGLQSDWEEMIDTNIKGLLYMTRALLPSIIKNRGHVINMGSVAGHWTYPTGNVYCATKYAVHALSESLRLDLNGTGVRVTEISPGMAETEFSEVRFHGDKQKAKAVYNGMTPLNASDIARAVVWASEQPPHVNIQDIVIFPTDQPCAMGKVPQFKDYQAPADSR